MSSSYNYYTNSYQEDNNDFDGLNENEEKVRKSYSLDPKNQILTSFIFFEFRSKSLILKIVFYLQSIVVIPC